MQYRVSRGQVKIRIHLLLCLKLKLARASQRSIENLTVKLYYFQAESEWLQAPVCFQLCVEEARPVGEKIAGFDCRGV